MILSGNSEPAVSLVQDDAKDQEPSRMWNFIIGVWVKDKMSLLILKISPTSELDQSRGRYENDEEEI